jgi:hypothetical protein
MSARAMYCAAIMCTIMANAQEGGEHAISLLCAAGLFVCAIFEERAEIREEKR